MKIVHLCVSCFYIDGFGYQENELVRQHVADGHDVLVIASTETFDAEGRLTYVQPREYVGTDGAKVVRLPYRRVLPHRIMRKLRAHPGVRTLLERARPDLIVFHGLCGWELLTVARYAARFPNVKVFADSHEDHFNSGRNWLSRDLLHGQYYRRILHAALPVLQPILCISVDTMRFVHEVYRIPEKQLEFFPLGGRVFDDDEYQRRRARTRAEFHIEDHETLFVQSGKMDAAKRLIESLRAFAEVPSQTARFLVAGSLDASIKSEALALIDKDPRVRFIGWLASDRLRDLLCAADLYVQPGSQSATMQMSLCCRCPVILDDVASHEPFVQGCGWLVRDQGELVSAVLAAAADPTGLRRMSEVAAGIAARMLDYRELAARLTR